MSFIVFNTAKGRLSVEISLPVGKYRAGWSRGSIWHLHKPGAKASLCGRVPMRLLHERDADHAGTGYLMCCPECFMKAQREETRRLSR